ncbi:MAG: PP2C family protein-serine/threonine phosphatase [Desulfatibacillaceae bacterium]
MLEIGTKIEGATEYLEDRLAVVELGEATVFVVADGSGGMADADKAAEAVVRAVSSGMVGDPAEPGEWYALLQHVDKRVFRNPDMGETTAVIVSLVNNQLVGASVGDSEAWLITAGEWFELTENQLRKPLVGSGECIPSSFGPHSFIGTLLVASDGLFHYTRYETVRETAVTSPPEQAVEALVDLVRLPGGGLQGDVAVIVARHG